MCFKIIFARSQIKSPDTIYIVFVHFYFIAVIQLPHVLPVSRKSFLSLATSVILSVLNVQFFDAACLKQINLMMMIQSRF